MLYVLLAILLFGILIFIHELGHYLTARLFKVKINEFAIGMGPKIISKKSKKTGIAYSLRLLPIGGFVSMEGEDSESEDEGAFGKKPVWQRIIITAAGSLSNILLGIIVMAIITANTTLVSTTVRDFAEGAVSSEMLEAGDKITRIGAQNTYTGQDVVYAITRYGKEPTEVTVIRNGEKTTLTVSFGTVTEEGHVFGVRDFNFYTERQLDNANFFTFIGHSLCQSRLMIRMVVDSIHDLVVGEYSIKDLSGPVGVTEVVSDAARQNNGTVWFYFVLIAMNLGLVNLLPIPALDGGRIVFMLIELITRKRVPQKVEAIIHTVGIIILLALMAVITFKDILHLFKK